MGTFGLTNWSHFFAEGLLTLSAPKLSRADQRGRPLTPEDIVLLSLDILRGGQFMRTQGVMAGCAKSSVFNLLYE